jgi:predicted dehydrogenase
MRPDLSGGALLDLGIYAVSLSHFLFGRPDDVVVRVKMHPLGVDETATFVLSYPNTMGVFTVRIGASLSETAAIIGSTGRIDLGRTFISPRWMRVSRIAEAPARQSAHAVSRGGKFLRAIPYGHILRNSILRMKSFLNARMEFFAERNHKPCLP